MMAILRMSCRRMAGVAVWRQFGRYVGPAVYSWSRQNGIAVPPRSYVAVEDALSVPQNGVCVREGRQIVVSRSRSEQATANSRGRGGRLKQHGLETVS